MASCHISDKQLPELLMTNFYDATRSPCVPISLSILWCLLNKPVAKKTTPAGKIWYFTAHNMFLLLNFFFLFQTSSSYKLFTENTGEPCDYCQLCKQNHATCIPLTFDDATCYRENLVDSWIIRTRSVAFTKGQLPSKCQRYQSLNCIRKLRI